MSRLSKPDWRLFSKRLTAGSPCSGTTPAARAAHRVRRFASVSRAATPFDLTSALPSTQRLPVSPTPCSPSAAPSD